MTNNGRKPTIPLPPSGGGEDSMNNKISLICAHCKGSIIQKYDDIYCIQCRREPTKEEPAIISTEEYKQNKRGDNSINLSIHRAAQRRGRASMRYSR